VEIVQLSFFISGNFEGFFPGKSPPDPPDGPFEIRRRRFLPAKKDENGRKSGVFQVKKT